MFHKYSGAKDSRQASQGEILDESARLGRSCSIGVYSVIDKDWVIGNNCIIGNRVSSSNCVIGDNCIIQTGTVIGEDGFAIEGYETNELLHFPHVGKVIIGDNVEICTN